MQVDVRWVLLGGCCLAVFFMILGVFVFERFNRLYRRFFVIGIVNRIIGETKEEIEDEVKDIPIPELHRHNREEMQDMAESLDFDAAVARHKQDDDDSAESPSSTPPLGMRRERDDDDDDDLDDDDMRRKDNDLRSRVRRNREDHDIERIDRLTDDD